MQTMQQQTARNRESMRRGLKGRKNMSYNCEKFMRLRLLQGRRNKTDENIESLNI